MILIEGKTRNPLWSPGGKMIVYTGEQVSAFSAMKAVDPEGTPIELPDIDLLAGGERIVFDRLDLAR